MTDIEKKALALLNEVSGQADVAPYTYLPRSDVAETLCRAIEQHEAFRQEVSDALEKRCFYIDDRDLGRFIIAKPDPLVEAVGEAMEAHEVYSKFELTDSLREALAKRGMKIAMEND